MEQEHQISSLIACLIRTLEIHMNIRILATQTTTTLVKIRRTEKSWKALKQTQMRTMKIVQRMNQKAMITKRMKMTQIFPIWMSICAMYSRKYLPCSSVIQSQHLAAEVFSQNNYQIYRQPYARHVVSS